MFLYIQDVMVLPDYQGQKLGTQIMERLLANVQELKSEIRKSAPIWALPKEKKNSMKGLDF